MRIINEWGLGVEVDGGLTSDPRTIETARDVMIIKLRARGLPFRVIGGFLGMSKQAAQQRYQRIPGEARAFYRSRPLGWLDTA